MHDNTILLANVADLVELFKMYKGFTYLLTYLLTLQLSILSLYLPCIAIIKAHVVTWPNWVGQDVRRMSGNISFHTG